MTQELFNQRKLEYERREEMIENIRNGVNMTVHGKRSLKRQIEKLTDDEQLKIYDIIVDNDEKQAMSIKSMSVLFDLEQLSLKTLWELDYYVKQCEWSERQNLIEQNIKRQHIENMSQLNCTMLKQSLKRNENEIDMSTSGNTNTDINTIHDEIIETEEDSKTSDKSNTLEKSDGAKMNIDTLFELSKVSTKIKKSRKQKNIPSTNMKNENCMSTKEGTDKKHVVRRRRRNIKILNPK